MPFQIIRNDITKVEADAIRRISIRGRLLRRLPLG